LAFSLAYPTVCCSRMARLLTMSGAARHERAWSGEERARPTALTSALEGKIPMPTAAKAALIDEMTEKLKRARGAVLLKTEGLTVAEMMDMRRKLTTSKIELHVVKNTLLRIAAQRADYQDLSALLTGQTAIALGYEDEVTPAKAITDYLKGAKTAK